MRCLLLVAGVITVIALTEARFGNVNEPPPRKNARGMRFQQMKEKHPKMVEEFAAFEANFREERTEELEGMGEKTQTRYIWKQYFKQQKEQRDAVREETDVVGEPETKEEGESKTKDAPSRNRRSVADFMEKQKNNKKFQARMKEVKTGAHSPGLLRKKMMEKFAANHQAAKEQHDKRNLHGKDEKNARGMRLQQLKENHPEIKEEFAAFEANFREERAEELEGMGEKTQTRYIRKQFVKHLKEQRDAVPEETEEVEETKPEEVEEAEPEEVEEADPEEVEETETEDATGSRRRRAVPEIDPNTIEAVSQVFIGGGRRARGRQAAPNMNPEERKGKMARFHELVKKHSDEFKAIRANESLSKKEKMQQMAAIVKKERQQ